MLLGDSSALYDIQKTSGLDITADNIRTEWLKLQNGNISWMLLSYETSNRLQLLDSGVGTIESFQSYLCDNSVIYGAFNVRLDTNQIRQVFLTFVGEAVVGMQRARVSMHRSAVNNYFQGSVLALALTDHSELQSASVVRALAQSGLQVSSGGALGNMIGDGSSITATGLEAVNNKMDQFPRQLCELELLDTVLRRHAWIDPLTVTYPSLGSVEPPECLYWRVLQAQLAPCESLDLLNEYEERVLAQIDEVSNNIMQPLAELFVVDSAISAGEAKGNGLAEEQVKLRKPRPTLQHLLAALAKLTGCTDEVSRMGSNRATLQAVSAAWAELARRCRGTDSNGSVSGSRDGVGGRSAPSSGGEGPLLSLLLLAECIARLADRAVLPTQSPRLTNKTSSVEESLIKNTAVRSTDTKPLNPATSSSSSFRTVVSTTTPSILPCELLAVIPNPVAAIMKARSAATITAANSAETQHISEAAESTCTPAQSSAISPRPIETLLVARPLATIPTINSAETQLITENAFKPAKSTSATPDPIVALMRAKSAAAIAATNSADAQLMKEISDNISTPAQLPSNTLDPIAALMKARSATITSPHTQVLLLAPEEEIPVAVIPSVNLTSAPASEAVSQAQFEKMLLCGVPEVAVRVKMERARMSPELVNKLCPNTIKSTTPDKVNQRRAANTSRSNLEASNSSYSQSTGPALTMRRCFWDPMPTDAGIEGTIFDSLSRSQSHFGSTRQLDSASFEPWGEAWAAGLKASFTISTRKRDMSEAERVGRAVGAIGGTLKKGSLTFMDQRRFNNIAIKLKQLRQSPEFLKQAVLTLDERFLSFDRVEALLQCSPSGDDLEAIAPYDGDPELLATVERFFYEVQHVPIFTRRIEAYRARLELDGEIVDYAVMAGHWSLACLRVGSSHALKQFIRLVLRIGNFLNAGGEDYTNTGIFSGPNTAETYNNSFDINFLLKLMHVRSADLKTNLLRFTLDRLHEDRPDILHTLQADLYSCREAAAINQKRLDASASQIARKISVIKSVVTAVTNKYKSSRLGRPPEDMFETKMGLFLSRADLLFRAASRQANNARQLCDRLVTYLGLQGSPSGAVKSSSTVSGPVPGEMTRPVVTSSTISSVGDSVFGLLLETESAIAAARAASIEASKNEQRRVKQAEARLEAFHKKAAAVERRRAKEQAEATRAAAGNEEGDRTHIIGERALSNVGRLHSVKSVFPSKQQLLQGEILLARHRMKVRGNTRPYSDFDPIPSNNGSDGGSASSGSMAAPSTSPTKGLRKCVLAGRIRRVEELRFGPMSVSPACVTAWSKVQSTGPSPSSTNLASAVSDPKLADTADALSNVKSAGPSPTSMFPNFAASECTLTNAADAPSVGVIQAPATQAIGDGVNWLVAKLLSGPSAAIDTARLELVATGPGGFSEMQTWLDCASVDGSESSGNCDGVVGSSSRVRAKKWTAKELLSLDKGSLGCAVGVCRVMASDGDSRRVKLVAVYLIDDSLPNRTRVFATAFKRHVQSFLLGVHVEFTVGGGNELTKEEVVKHLLAAGGAHAPKTFEF